MDSHKEAEEAQRRANKSSSRNVGERRMKSAQLKVKEDEYSQLTVERA